MYFNKELVDLSALKLKFKEMLEDKKYLLQIGADKDSKHSSFVNVLDVAKEVGVENIGILTKLEREKRN